MAIANEIETGMVCEPAAPDLSLLHTLQQISTYKHLREEDLVCFDHAEWIHLDQGATFGPAIVESGYFWALFEGEISLTKIDAKYAVPLTTMRSGDTFGEVPLLRGSLPGGGATCLAMAPCRMLRIPRQSFWKLMERSPATRELVQLDFSHRFELYQAMALHREKLISLGTLAAGLMHELNNPGAAARRAAAQLRENISRLQNISLRLTRSSLTEEQKSCVHDLQERVFQVREPSGLNSLEQSDREEELSSWLEEAGVENAWRMAPTFVSVGWQPNDILCARSLFPEGVFSDVLNYLDALITSTHHVTTIEESITRVTDLVSAVKKYAYDDKKGQRAVNVQESLLSTLTILEHKFRHKNIHVERMLSQEKTPVFCVGAGLVQVWTNLLDNAVDAVPEGGRLVVRLWIEEDRVCVGIRDNGPGIPREHWEHIFEPFYTTKEAGVGTGLGLDIAHRIVVGNFHGDIRFSSGEEGTEFIVRLPLEQGANAETCTIGNGSTATQKA
jgi:signal transduction histidine kinase